MCGKEKEVKTKKEAESRTFCSRTCVKASFVKKHAVKGRPKKVYKKKEVERYPRKNTREIEYPIRKRRRSMMQIIEMERPHKRYKRREILLAMRTFTEKIGREAPSENEWVRHKCKPTSRYIIKKFGNWSHAVKEMKALPPKYEYKLSMTHISG